MRSKNLAVADQKRCVACGSCMKARPKEAVSVWRGYFAAVPCGKSDSGVPWNRLPVLSPCQSGRYSAGEICQLKEVGRRHK